MRISNNKRCKY